MRPPLPDQPGANPAGPRLSAHLVRRQQTKLWEYGNRESGLLGPTVNPHETELVSGRVENYQYSSVWGFIADQAWLR